MAAVAVSTATKIGLVLLGVGFLFHIIGFAAPYWHRHGTVEFGHSTTVYYGLWKYCYEEVRYTHRPYDICFSLVDNSGFARDYIRAAQFFETIGFLAILVAIVLLLLGICIEACKDRRVLPILSAIVAMGAAGCVVLGCIIFGAKDAEKHYLSWAFALALVGGLFYGVAGVVVLVAAIFIKKA